MYDTLNRVCYSYNKIKPAGGHAEVLVQAGLISAGYSQVVVHMPSARGETRK